MRRNEWGEWAKEQTELRDRRIGTPQEHGTYKQTQTPQENTRKDTAGKQMVQKKHDQNCTKKRRQHTGGTPKIYKKRMYEHAGGYIQNGIAT